jgi:hypothetical protein
MVFIRRSSSFFASSKYSLRFSGATSSCPARCRQFCTDCSGLFTSCAMDAVSRPAAAIFSTRSRACCDSSTLSHIRAGLHTGGRSPWRPQPAGRGQRTSPGLPHGRGAPLASRAANRTLCRLERAIGIRIADPSPSVERSACASASPGPVALITIGFPSASTRLTSCAAKFLHPPEGRVRAARRWRRFHFPPGNRRHSSSADDRVSR